ncbi:MAG: 2,3-bisphosphoglycerate-independent phosphoglycerate mutase [Dehalococcoidia bacterium]
MPVETIAAAYHYALMDDVLLNEIVIPGTSKILLLVMDGLGGLPHLATGRTELEQADTPHLDVMARDSICGLTIPVAPGVTPGSGPGHLALFGYDPIANNIGRGVLEAVGIDFELDPSDVAARGNFCTVDADGVITDRRAGRVPTEISTELCKQLAAITLPGVQTFVEPVREHRFVLVLRGEGLSDRLTGTDPNREGVPPLAVQPLAPEAAQSAELVNRWIVEAKATLAGRERANMVMVRGFAKYPTMPSMWDRYKLKAAAIAIYPMYRGLAKLVGLTPLPGGSSFEEEIETVRRHWNDFDFFFVHYKPTDAAGEDGDYHHKVEALEALDKLLPRLTELEPDVFMVGGDHSTPAIMAAHSWHPVPFMLRSKWCRADRADEFNEPACQLGSLGTFPATQALSLAMAHAGRFTKYGA